MSIVGRQVSLKKRSPINLLFYFTKMTLLAQKRLMNSGTKDDLPNKEVSSKYCNVCFIVIHCKASSRPQYSHVSYILYYQEILCNDPFFYIFILNRQSPCPSTLIEYQNPSHESIFILCFYILKSLLIHTYVILFHEYNESIRLKSLAFSQ